MYKNNQSNFYLQKIQLFIQIIMHLPDSGSDSGSDFGSDSGSGSLFGGLFFFLGAKITQITNILA